ncbi:MAG: DNA recombination protein RmuC, partial [Burkholderiales bacterium]
RRAFGRSLRDRIDEIADKYIRPDEGTYDFALMYIPAENVYYEAVLRAHDPEDGRSALSHALRRRVIPVSPHTLYAYLMVILHGLRGMAVERRAREIRDRLGALRQQFETLWAALDKVGVHLGNAQKQFDEGSRQAGRVRERLDAITSAALEPGDGEGAKENGGE